MTTPLVNASKHDGVMVLELSNPPANTYSHEMMRSSTRRCCRRASIPASTSS